MRKEFIKQWKYQVAFYVDNITYLCNLEKKINKIHTTLEFDKSISIV